MPPPPPSASAAWTPADGYEATHDVSACGHYVRSRRTGHVLKRSRDGRVLLIGLATRRWAFPHDLLAVCKGGGAKPGRATPPARRAARRATLGLCVAAAAAAALIVASSPSTVVAAVAGAADFIGPLLFPSGGVDATFGAYRDGGGPFFYPDSGM